MGQSPGAAINPIHSPQKQNKRGEKNEKRLREREFRVGPGNRATGTNGSQAVEVTCRGCTAPVTNGRALVSRWLAAAAWRTEIPVIHDIGRAYTSTHTSAGQSLNNAVGQLIRSLCHCV